MPPLLTRGRTPLLLVATCMLLVLATGRSIAVSSRIANLSGRSLSARARSSLSQAGLRASSALLPPPSAPTSLPPLSSWSLRTAPAGGGGATAGDDSSGEQGGSGDKVPATGWNHNPPSEASRFWKAPNGDSAAARQQAGRGDPSSPGEASTKPPRTGWLHNTKPTPKVPTKGAGGGDGISVAQQRLKVAMRQQEENHRIISPAAFHACGGDRQIAATDHRISVPVYRTGGDGGAAAGARIDVAFTIVEEVKDGAGRRWFESLAGMSPTQRARAYVDKAAMANADDMLVYLQGGPGFGSPAPVVGLAFSKGSSWGASALDKYKRIVLMDQRGTGRSTPITKQNLQQRFPDLFALDGLDASDSGELDQLAAAYPDEAAKFKTALEEATRFVAQFRADDIVGDAETVREALLLPPEAGQTAVPRPWGCSLGQSYGGFCTMTYLSLVDHPPQVALLTGGIAPMGVTAFDLYTALWAKVKERSLQYYSMYPGDVAAVKKIVRKLLLEPPRLPSGGALTARRFLQVGMMLGGGPSSFAALHGMLSTAFLQPEETDFTRAFLKAMDSATPFDEHPIYFWLHESIYADGPRFSPTNWSADRAYRAKMEEASPPSEFDYAATSESSDDGRPILFFGEMVFPWMAKDYAECGGIGCAALSDALAGKADWGRLYDAGRMRAALREGRTRAAAAVYYDDIYVNFDSSMAVAARGGALEGCKVYITNEYQHSGLRDDGANLFVKLHGMATGSVRTPS